MADLQFQPVEKLLLTAEEAGELLSVGKGTIETLHRRGELVGFHCGRHLLYRISDVRAYVEARAMNNQEGLESDD